MPVQFQSKNRRMRVVLAPSRNIYGRDGVVGTEPGQTVEFENYVYQVDEPKARKLGMTQGELADALRDSFTYNREFWELGNAPDAQKPSVQDMLERITDAATRQNVEKLRELKQLEEVGDGETGGHRREEVLAAIDRPLGILTDGKEGKLGPGRPHKPKPHEPATASPAEQRKAMTQPDVS